MTHSESSTGIDPIELPPFDFDPRTRVVFGSGTVARLGELVREAGGQRILLVTDPGIEKAGHTERCLHVLQQAGLTVAVFDDVTPNPTTEDVERGLAAAKAAGIDFFVAVGGGSAMDCAKGINFLYTNGGRMQDYWGIGKATKPLLPLIAIPTTAGTGSEAQSYALIADAHSHMKMACGDKKAACRVAMLDPDLTLSMPAGVTAATGIDAISHAVESYVATRRNPVSQMFSRRSWRLLAKSFPVVIQQPNDRAARGAMLLGAHLAGAAIENSMLGATHALANPLTAHYGITHGSAIGVMLPHVIRYNSEVVGEAYGRLAGEIGVCAADDPHAADLLAETIERFVANSGSPTTLNEFAVEKSRLGELAGEAAEQWTGKFNPRPVNAAALEELYRCAFSR
jgi:alcohol dehydrogenase